MLSGAARSVPACFRGQAAQPPAAQGSLEQLSHSPSPFPLAQQSTRKAQGALERGACALQGAEAHSGLARVQDVQELLSQCSSLLT